MDSNIIICGDDADESDVKRGLPCVAACEILSSNHKHNQLCALHLMHFAGKLFTWASVNIKTLSPPCHLENSAHHRRLLSSWFCLWNHFAFNYQTIELMGIEMRIWRAHMKYRSSTKNKQQYLRLRFATTFAIWCYVPSGRARLFWNTIYFCSFSNFFLFSSLILVESITGNWNTIVVKNMCYAINISVIKHDSLLWFNFANCSLSGVLRNDSIPFAHFQLQS